MPRPATRRSRPCVERLESLDLPSAGLPAFANLTATPVAADAKRFLSASTPAAGRQRGVVNALVAVPGAAGLGAGGDAVAGVMTLQYRVKVLPSFLSPFSPSVSFAMDVSFATSLDDPRPGDVAVSYTKNLIANGASVRARVAAGIVAFLRHDRAAIAAALGHG